jgi:hypothetical protein
MTFTFETYVRGSEKPISRKKFETYDEALEAANEWSSKLGPIEDFRYEGYIADEEEIKWYYPKALTELTFDSMISASGHSLVIFISKQAQMMGLHRDDVVNVTLRRITDRHEERSRDIWMHHFYYRETSLYQNSQSIY